MQWGAGPAHEDSQRFASGIGAAIRRPCRWRGCLSQVVEQLSLNQRVVGSSPTAPTTTRNSLPWLSAAAGLKFAARSPIGGAGMADMMWTFVLLAPLAMLGLGAVAPGGLLAVGLVAIGLL